MASRVRVVSTSMKCGGQSTAMAAAAEAPAHFFERLEERCHAINSVLCVGLDPHASELASPTAASALAFCTDIVRATAEFAAAFKPNAAFFEAFGSEGWESLRVLIQEVIRPTGALVVLDCKRGDIGSTSEAYATACFDVLGADCVTLHGYMGSESVDPFVSGARLARGAFVLCKTSNPSSSQLQELILEDGVTRVFEAVAGASEGWGANVGLVVGATDLEALRAVRRVRPTVWILAPGVGAQGASATEAMRAGARGDGLGLLVPVSRGISRAIDRRDAAKALRDELNEARASCGAPTGSLARHRERFLQAAMEAGVLKFGDFTLKSGRKSPYFFNAGLFTTGRAIRTVGESYASEIVASGLEFDVVFGPAYKGIPLATTVAISLAGMGRDTPMAFNRKEIKDHGEGGLVVGSTLRGQRVLLVDDVMSSGKAVTESVDVIRAEGGTLMGIVVGLDRQERRGEEDGRSAVMAVSDEFGVPVLSVATLTDLIAMLSARGGSSEEQLVRMTEYRAVWGTAE
jgi:uridine monophosphate synthetase